MWVGASAPARSSWIYKSCERNVRETFLSHGLIRNPN
jgi:hypothetical protein